MRVDCMACGFLAEHEYQNREFIRAIVSFLPERSSRVVYKTENGIRLSGVVSVAPPAGKHIVNDRARFPLGKDDTWEIMNDRFRELNQEEGTGMHGPKPYRQNAFIWHKDYWKSLMGHFGADPVDLHALFEACRVAPRVISE